MADLGDIGGFLRGGSVSNLDWLEVDEAEYRKLDNLPKQNLDISPDLEAIWAHEGESPTSYLIPNVTPVEAFRGAGEPHTMGDLSQVHGQLRASPDLIRKTARMALMQSPDLHRFRNVLATRYDSESLQAARAVLGAVLSERGLLGKLYIDAADFPSCHTGAARPSEFVKRYAGDARFVLAKPECSGCVHAQSHQSGESCSVFHKEIQVEVPMTDGLASDIERMQQTRGKNVSKQASLEPRERIRLAMLADDFHAPGSSPMPHPKDNVARLMRQGGADAPDFVKPQDLTYLKAETKTAVGQALQTGRISVQAAQQAYRIIAMAVESAPIEVIRVKALGLDPEPLHVYAGVGQQAPLAQVSEGQVETQLIAASQLTRKRDEEALRLLSARRAAPVVAFVRREMLKGRDREDLASMLRHAFAEPDIAEAREHWLPLFKEAGLYGAIYSTQDSFGDCHEGADFLAKYNPGVKVLVAGAKCNGCIHNKIGRCLMYGKPLLRSAEEAYTPDLVAQVRQEYHSAGLLDDYQSKLGQEMSPREQLVQLHTAASLIKRRNFMAYEQRHSKQMETGFYGSSQEHRTSSLTRGDVVKAARRFLNEGLYGTDLKLALKARFESRDITASAAELRPVLAEQGLQGVFFVDPTVYEDYGKGCKEAASLHRSRLVEYVRYGDKCGSCVHQTRPGFCSVINKRLVDDPPYYDRTAQQRDILSMGRSTETSFNNLVNNGMSIMAEYEMQHGQGPIEVNDLKVEEEVGIEWGGAGQGIKL